MTSGIGTLLFPPLGQGACPRLRALGICCPALNPKRPGICKGHFPQTLRESEKNVFLTVAYPHSPKSTSLPESCFCAEGSSSRCLACTPSVQESVPFLFYFTQRGRDNPPRLPRIPLSPVAVTRETLGWSPGLKRPLGSRLDSGAGVRGKPPEKLGSQVGRASLEAVPPFVTTALPVVQGATGWDVGLLCQQGLYLRSLQTSQARRKKMTLI